MFFVFYLGGGRRAGDVAQDHQLKAPEGGAALGFPAKKILSLFLKKYDASNTCKFRPSPPEDEESFDKKSYEFKNIFLLS